MGCASLREPGWGRQASARLLVRASVSLAGLAAPRTTLESSPRSTATAIDARRPRARLSFRMTSTAVERFLSAAAAQCRSDPADCVLALAPLMLDLLQQHETLLEPQHYRSHPDGYTRNLIHDAPDGSLSLYSIVWLPGQWTPVHDHGSWGLVGVLEGVLEERSYVRLSPDRGADAGIELVRGGVILLGRAAVTSFVPNPDHIHVTGVPADRPRAVSLHLYGRMMSSFNTYDVAAGTRRPINAVHNEI